MNNHTEEATGALPQPGDPTPNPARAHPGAAYASVQPSSSPSFPAWSSGALMDTDILGSPEWMSSQFSLVRSAQ